MNDNKHISKEDFILFQQNLMHQDDKEEFLTHIGSCNYCADQFATLISEDIIIAPRNMKANILAAAKRPEVQLANKAKEVSKKMQLLWFSFKVGTAMICALILLAYSMNFTNTHDKIKVPVVTSIGVNQNEKGEPITAIIRNNMDQISNSILNFSNHIMKTEVTNHDKQEK